MIITSNSSEAKSSWNAFQKEYAATEGVQGILGFFCDFRTFQTFFGEGRGQMLSKRISMHALCMFFS
jgi:hypothetical protein